MFYPGTYGTYFWSKRTVAYVRETIAYGPSLVVLPPVALTHDDAGNPSAMLLEPAARLLHMPELLS